MLYNPASMNILGDGFFNVIKPPYITSYDVIRRIRPLLGKKTRIGHAGVIDKPARGVLPLGIGKATKLFDVLSSYSKDYFAWIALGITSPTLDLGSETKIVNMPTDRKTSLDIARRALESASEFTGEIEQIPPAYSNIKIDGKELYRYELEQEKVELKPRKVFVHRFEFTRFMLIHNGDLEVLDDPALPNVNASEDFGLPALSLDTPIETNDAVLIAEIYLDCETGTYVRAIARDIGNIVETGGLIASLTRTRVGPFGYADAVSLDELACALENDRTAALDKYLLPMSTVIPDAMRLNVYLEEARALSSGNYVNVLAHRLPDNILDNQLPPEDVFAVLDNGRLVAKCTASEWQNRPGLWRVKPLKVFLQ